MHYERRCSHFLAGTSNEHSRGFGLWKSMYEADELLWKSAPIPTSWRDLTIMTSCEFDFVLIHDLTTLATSTDISFLQCTLTATHEYKSPAQSNSGTWKLYEKGKMKHLLYKHVSRCIPMTHAENMRLFGLFWFMGVWEIGIRMYSTRPGSAECLEVR